jgi:ribosome maturation factor RimP
VPLFIGLILMARPGAAGVFQGLQDQDEQGLRQTSGNSRVQGKSARGASAPRKSGGAPADRPGRPERAPREIPTGPRLGWREAILATVSGFGFELVDIERAERGLLRVTIDRVPGKIYPIASEFVLVEDCEQVTRQLQYALEVEAMEYARLEVSSPGLDRPLKTEADFDRFSGQAVKITLKLPFEGRKVWQGVLGRAQPEAEAGAAPGWSLVFKTGKTEQVLGFKFEEVREARLVPVVDFKGRKSAGQAADSDQADEAPVQAAASGIDGGLRNP